MLTELSLQILPFTTTTASDQDPFKTMLQKMKSRNLASSIVFRGKFKCFRTVFYSKPFSQFILSPNPPPCPPNRLPVRRSALTKEEAKEDRTRRSTLALVLCTLHFPRRVRYFFFIGRFPVRNPNKTNSGPLPTPNLRLSTSSASLQKKSRTSAPG